MNVKTTIYVRQGTEDAIFNIEDREGGPFLRSDNEDATFMVKPDDPDALAIEVDLELYIIVYGNSGFDGFKAPREDYDIVALRRRKCPLCGNLTGDDDDSSG